MEEAVLGLEVEEGASQLMVEVEQFRSPDKIESSMMQHVQEQDKAVFKVRARQTADV